MDVIKYMEIYGELQDVNKIRNNQDKYLHFTNSIGNIYNIIL